MLLLLHGLIHTLGMAKAWNLWAAPSLSGKAVFPLSGSLAKVLGGGWLLAALLFIVCAVLFFLRRGEWWAWAIAGSVLSQVLIVLYWPDAKAGTVANILILLVALAGAAEWRFARLAAGDVERLLTAAEEAGSPPVIRNIPETLPPAVRRWLLQSQIVGKPAIRTAHLQQRGALRTRPDGKWMPFTAEQVFSIHPPAFVWRARIRAAPWLHIAGRDKYLDGRGNMLIRLLSAFTIADAAGEEIDQGSLLRFLGEIVWLPTAALSNDIRWEAVDENRARATLRWAGQEVAGLFTFNQAGQVTHFSARRYYEQKGEYSLQTWSIEVLDYANFDGIPVPQNCEVTWELDTGDFKWLKLAVTDVRYGA